MGGNPHFDVLGELGFFDDVANYAYHIRISQGFTLESIVFKIRLVSNFFVVDRFMYGGKRIIGDRPHFEFFGQT